MSSFELGEAFVRVRPDTDRFESDAKRGIGGALSNVFSGSAMMGSLDSLGGAINKTIVGAFAVASAAGGALVAKAFGGGLKRVLDTEDATIAFQQMGLSVQDIDRVLSGVDRTFDGTPFANPDGFNISAQLLASGRALEDVERDLLGIANVTSQTLDKDLNRTSETFLKVAATGRVYARDLNSLAMQGIPIRNILADALGVTTEELNDMVSAGEVTFDMMMDAVNATERFDGAAQAMGSSTRGAFANVMTGVSRLGESFLGPLFGQNGYMVQSLQAIRNALRAATPYADALGERFANWLGPKMKGVVEGIGPFILGLQGIRQQVDPLTGQLDQVGGRAHEFGLAVRGVIDQVREAVSWVRNWVQDNPKLTGAIGTAIPIVMGLASVINAVRFAFLLLIRATPLGMVMALVTGLTYAWQNSETFRNIVTGAFEAVQRVISTVVEFIGGLIERVVGWFQGLGQSSEDSTSWIGQTWEQLMGIFGQVGEVLGLMWDHFQESFALIRELLTGFFDWSAPFWEAAWEGIKATFEYIWEVIKSTITVVLDVISGLLEVFLGVITGDWERAWEGILSIFTGVWEHGQRVFAAGLNFMKRILSAALNFIRSIWSGAWNWLQGFNNRIMSAIRNAISSAFNSIRNTVRSIVNGIRSIISTVFNGIRNLMRSAANSARSAVLSAFNAMRNGVRSRVNSLLTFVRGIPRRILSALGNVGRLLYNAGRNILRGLVNGIRSLARAPVNAVRNVVSSVRRLLPFSPAKEGPFSGKGAPEESGRAIIGDLIKGIRGSERELRGALSGVLGDGLNPRVGMGAGVGGGAGTQVTIDKVEIAAKDVREMNDVIDFFEKVKVTARAGALT